MNLRDLCKAVYNDAIDTRLRIEAFRVTERHYEPVTEPALRAAIEDRMSSLRTWSTIELGAEQPERPRVGYTPPWTHVTVGSGGSPFGRGVGWVDLRRPRWLHPLPSGHSSIERVIEATVRSQERIPGMATVPPAALDLYREQYRQARQVFDAQPAPLIEATAQHRSVRSAMLTAFRTRARAMGNPTANLSFADLITIEAAASDGAFEALLSWLGEQCDQSRWLKDAFLRGVFLPDTS